MPKWEYMLFTGVNFGEITNATSTFQVARLTTEGIDLVTDENLQALSEKVSPAHYIAASIAAVGESGWELVTVNERAWIFKRPISSAEEREEPEQPEAQE